MWWNAGLRNGRGGRSSAQKRKAAYSVISALLQKNDLDVLGLCEVGLSDIKELEKNLGKSGFGIVSAQERRGKLQFDMCLIYRIETIVCRDLDEPVLIDSESGSNMKVAYMIEAIVDGGRLIFALSHWPARSQRHDGHTSRDYLGDSLRKFVDQQRKKGTHQVALMGDYNDEPHSDVITTKLRAVRDHTLATEHEGYLYNPFWRHLAGNPGYRQGREAGGVSGTHYYTATHHRQRWWLFDQMMFSPSFISDGPWHLNEDGTGIISMNRRVADWLLYSTELNPEVSNKASNEMFDHLPIYATLERASQDG